VRQLAIAATAGALGSIRRRAMQDGKPSLLLPVRRLHRRAPLPK